MHKVSPMCPDRSVTYVPGSNTPSPPPTRGGGINREGPEMTLHVFGIRHHGPGCARSLRGALDALRPDILLIEGPPDAEDVLPLLAHEGLTPPVALLVYPPEAPDLAVFYPFAVFSPEWQALRYAVENKIPVRFIDMPQAHRLASALEFRKTVAEAEADGGAVPSGGGSSANEELPPEEPHDGEDALHHDPIGMLAEAAGYGDRELWWEHQIEQRQDVAGLFDGILSAMAALREKSPPAREEEARREAFMRTGIRTAQKDGFARIAVVCGAWHAPVLQDPDKIKGDAQLLKGLPKVKTAATWIPWTHSRLSYRSGYGAGIASPGWYQHLWVARDRAALRWVAQAAQLRRGEDLDASSASVIETVRLAEALAAMRALPMPGLAELNESLLSVLCRGEEAPLSLIRARLEIGEALGEVPEETPTIPLQRDLEAKQKSLRLKPTTEIKTLELDLRNDTDRARSRLLRQLLILRIDWGSPQKAIGGKGTFHEHWKLQWNVEFPVRLIEASVWGNTMEDAAGALLRKRGDEAADLPALTVLLDQAILAGLPDAIAHLLARVRAQSAVTADIGAMMRSLPALARVARYGDVRGTAAADVMPVIDTLLQRAVIGLPGAVSSLDDPAAETMVEAIGEATASVGLLDRPDMRDDWQQIMRTLADLEGCHGLVRGVACRLLVEQQVIGEAELRRRARLALSPANPAAEAAAWVQGLVRGSGMVLLHQDGLWAALDEWLVDLPADVFTELLPLLRRAFSDFQPPERRAMGDKAKHLRRLAERAEARLAREASSAAGLVRERADRVLPILAQILGSPHHGG